MRVAFVVPSLGATEGQGNVNFELLRRIVDAGHDVHVFSSLLPERVRDLKATVHELPRTSVQLLNQILMVSGSTRALRGEKFDVIHADGPITRAVVDVAMCHMPHAAWTRLPKDASRETGPRGMLSRASAKYNLKLERRVYVNARRVLVASDLAATVLKDSGVDPNRIVVVPFGVDAAKFRPATGDERRLARHRFGIAHDEFCVAFVGAQGPRKGLPALLAAIDPRDRLLVAGDRRSADAERIAQKRSLNATFTGKVEDVRAVYWAADVLVAPSRFDAFGMSIVEAMACGIPVVTSKASGASARVGEGGVVLADPTDVEGLSKVIVGLREDPFGRARMGVIGRQQAESWSWDEAGQILLRIYEHVAESKRDGVAVEAA